MLFMGIFAPFLTSYSPIDQSLPDKLLPPFWEEGGSIKHLFGTDIFGRDVLTRLYHGARVSLIVTALALLVLVPVALKGFDRRHSDYLARQSQSAGGSGESRDWTRLEVLRDPRYLGVMVLLLAYPYVSTGVLFHQAFIGETRGWPIELLATGLISMAFMKVLTSLAIGPMIDRSGAVRLVPASALPFIASFVALGISNHPLIPYVYLGVLGVGIGMLQPILSAMFAEMYGVRNLGGIRAMSVAAMVLAAAAAPASFGYLFDSGVSIETVVTACILYMVLAAGLAVLVLLRHKEPVNANN